MTFADTSDQSYYTVEVGDGDESPEIVLKESNLFGETAIAFSAEKAEWIAYSLLRAVNALRQTEIDETEPLKLVASL